jgi:hypothetical protein
LTSPELARLIDRRVSPEELREALERPIGADEREDVLSLTRWFSTRYGSAEARLAYVRNAYQRWFRDHLTSDRSSVRCPPDL